VTRAGGQREQPIHREEHAGSAQLVIEYAHLRHQHRVRDTVRIRVLAVLDLGHIEDHELEESHAGAPWARADSSPMELVFWPAERCVRWVKQATGLPGERM
jgi:hypothetical protein